MNGPLCHDPIDAPRAGCPACERWHHPSSRYRSLVAAIVPAPRIVIRPIDGDPPAGLDPATGLIRRRQVDNEVRRLVADVGPVALLMIDVDRFRTIRDGDVLRALAERLTALVADTATLGAVYSDEFLIAAGLDAAAAGALAETVRAGVAALPVLGHALTVSIGLGVQPAGPRTTKPDRLYKTAVMNLDAAKAKGGNSIVASILEAKRAKPKADPPTPNQPQRGRRYWFTVPLDWQEGIERAFAQLPDLPVQRGRLPLAGPPPDVAPTLPPKPLAPRPRQRLCLYAGEPIDAPKPGTPYRADAAGELCDCEGRWKRHCHFRAADGSAPHAVCRIADARGQETCCRTTVESHPTYCPDYKPAEDDA